MAVPIAELAELVDGTLIGDPEVAIMGIATIRNAHPGQITLAVDAHHLRQLDGTRASAAIVPDKLGGTNAADGPTASTMETPDNLTLIRVANPKEAFAVIARTFCPEKPRPATGVSPHAIVPESASVAAEVTIGPRCVIGENVTIGEHSVIHPGVVIMDGTQIGNNVTIFPNAVLYENTIVGDRCIIHACAVLGAYGFGFTSSESGHQPCEQIGNVILQDDVEVGAGTTIDRGTYGPTLIGKGTKLDNQVVIGHNCTIGEHNLLCGQAGIAGSCETGDFVVIAGQAGFRDHVVIGDHVAIGAKAGVAHSLTEPGQYLGSPAVPVRQEIQMIMARQTLPTMRKRLRSLEKTIQTLTEQMAKPTADASDPSEAA